MATKDWKELEGKMFRIDVASTTEEALKNENPAVISFTTDGDIVFNGEKFCKESEATSTKAGLLSAEDKVKLDSQKPTMKVMDLFINYSELKGNYILNFFGVDGTDPIDYPSEVYDEYAGEPLTLCHSLINGSDFVWFSRNDASDYGTHRVSSKAVLGITEEELNSNYNSMENGIVFNVKMSDFIRLDSDDSLLSGFDSYLFYKFVGILFNLEQGGFTPVLSKEINDEYNVIHLLSFSALDINFIATSDNAGVVKIGDGINVYNEDFSDKNGTISLAEATSTSLGGVKKAALNLQSEYEFLKVVPTITDIDDAKMAINHLRVICKTLVDKLEAAGALTK